MKQFFSIRKNGRRGFTIVELVIVIAVIAILAAVLIPTFSGIIGRANESKAIQEAKNAWSEVSYTYAAGYKGFAAAGDELNGWYYDYIDGVAKYDVGSEYTVTYDGEKFAVTAFDPAKALLWDAITATSVENSNSAVTNAPFGLTLSYYDTIYSRGFSWITKDVQADSKVYVVASNLGEKADFTDAPVYNATSTSFGSLTSYKANASFAPSTTYSFKAGSEAGGWEYGVFRTESAAPIKITAIQLSDAQTKDAAKLSAWENTFAQAIETAGHGLDFILYNGDQADANATEPSDFYARYGIARETVDAYVNDLPYMAAAGNHEPANSKTYVHCYTNAIDFGVDGDTTDGYGASGAYYSYDYGFAHFVVLDSNMTGAELTKEAEWLRNDLKASSAKWKIVMMHNGPYATGDHSNNAVTQNLITTFTPIFSECHVDLVLQAHDHTYNKTLAYKWDTVGYTTTYNNTDIVNFAPVQSTLDGVTYDLNPNGTYYVTTGAAGHRVGEAEKNDGCWADVLGSGKTNELTALNASKTFLNNTYKIEVGKVTQDNDYADVEVEGVNNDQHYAVGDPATGNVNAQMFGVLELTETTLTYSFYTVSGNDVNLFDTLNVMKN